MNWHETIESIQANPKFEQLVRDTYISKDLEWNANAFFHSDEFNATTDILKKHLRDLQGKLLDIGAGNGISSVAFAKRGFDVTALEPDPSNLVGAGAISTLKSRFGLQNIEIIEGFAEDIIEGKTNYFDVVYARQSLHHAADLTKFVETAYQMLKPGGLFLTIRDHMVYDDQDKALFLERHPLHKMYLGENAFTENQYLEAFENAGFVVLATLKHYDSVINYAPQTTFEVKTIPSEMQQKLRSVLGEYAHNKHVLLFVRRIYDIIGRTLFDEKNVAGRLRSFVLKKPAI